MSIFQSSSSSAPETWLPQQRQVAKAFKNVFMPAVFGGRFEESPMVRTLAELARSGASKQVGAMSNTLAETRGLAQPALAKMAGELPTKAMEASVGIYQKLHEQMMELAAQYAYMHPGAASKAKSAILDVSDIGKALGSMGAGAGAILAA
jgi:hypothetical protein